MSLPLLPLSNKTLPPPFKPFTQSPAPTLHRNRIHLGFRMRSVEIDTVLLNLVKAGLADVAAEREDRPATLFCFQAELAHCGDKSKPSGACAVCVAGFGEEGV